MRAAGVVEKYSINGLARSNPEGTGPEFLRLVRQDYKNIGDEPNVPITKGGAGFSRVASKTSLARTSGGSGL